MKVLIGYAAIDPISGEIVASKTDYQSLITAMQTVEINPYVKHDLYMIYEVMNNTSTGLNHLGKYLEQRSVNGNTNR